MLSAFFQLSSKCILRCRYCFYNTGYLSRNLTNSKCNFESIVNSISNLQIDNAIITGGDPFNSDDFDDAIGVIKMLRQKKIKASVNTSLAISSHQTSLIIEVSPDMIFVSCDSHQRKVHNAQRGKWDLTYNSLRKIVKSQIPVIVNCVVTLLNYKHIKEIYRFYMNLGVVDIDFNLAYLPETSIQYGLLSCEKLSSEERTTLIDDLLWCAEQGNNRKKKIAHIAHQAGLFLGIAIDTQLKKMCQMGKSFLVINSDGKVKPCFHSDETWGGISNHAKIIEEIEKRGSQQVVCAGKECSSLFAIDSFWESGG